jgi:hypothetical protein
MFIDLGTNQFLYADGQLLETEATYVGHGLKVDDIPENALLELRSQTSVTIPFGHCQGTGAVIFKGSKPAFLRWQEEYNGW